MQKNIPDKKPSGLFVYLLLLTGCFMFLELSLVFQYSDVYINDFQFLTDRLHIPLAIVPGILFFVAAQFFLHLGFTVIIWALAQLTIIAFNVGWIRCAFCTVIHRTGIQRWITVQKAHLIHPTEKLAFTMWVLGIITVLLANQYFFPNSKFSIITAFIIPSKLAFVLLLILTFIFSCITLVSLFGLFALLKNCHPERQRRIFSNRSTCWKRSFADAQDDNSLRNKIIFILLSTILLGKFFLTPPAIIADASTPEKPNIIIIGIDSLRPDFLGFFGYEKITPNMDNFLNHATVFADSFTPLARTFPAWVSILTGQYPKNNGARTDLINPNKLNLKNSLALTLQQNGYQTIFSTDETRFSNISSQFGFNSIIAPPVGFNDFLLGTINDFPFSNLIVNTFIGKYLFPHSYGNRPVAMTYDPNSFLNLLNSALEKPRDKPLFLAIHFCLTHTPYTWRATAAEKPYENYIAAVNRVDQQFQDLLNLLTKNKLLENSIVVLLSDHGEAFELPGDRITEAELFVSKKSIPHFYPPSLEDEKVNQSVGHGTDVLGLSQYRNVLAFRLYGKKQHTAIITGKVSLLDVQPTILELAKQPFSKGDGYSLKNEILGKNTSVPMRDDFFIESDFSPAAVHSIFPETRKVLLEGIEYFQVDPITTQFTVKESMEKMIYSSKQFADIYGSWMLALYPQTKNHITPILINLDSGQWTDDLNSSFAKSSPAKHMLEALHSHFEAILSS